MNLTLEDLAEHIAQIRHDLELKKSIADVLLFTDPVTALALRYQINCLEPRLAELERSARRMASEKRARLAAVPA
jgi:hypothetical protein